MILEKAIFTALPNGLDQHKRLRLSVHVAPRLTTDDGDPSPRELKEYPTFEAWPERLAGYGWKVEFDNGATAAATPDEGCGPIWPRLFPAETFVRPHAYTDHAKKTFTASRSARCSSSSIDLRRPVRGRAGPALDRRPERADRGIRPAGWAHKRDHRLELVLGRGGPRRSAAPGQGAPDAHGRPRQRLRVIVGGERVVRGVPLLLPPGVAPPDFDQEFGSDYVEPKPSHPNSTSTSRRPGGGPSAAAADARPRRGPTLELDDPLGQLGAGGMVRVIPDGELPTDVTVPWTRFDLEDRWFGARPKDAFRMEHGLVRLTPEFWDLFQVDVDGAALQAVGMGDVLARLTDPDQRNHETPSKRAHQPCDPVWFSLARQRRADDLLEGLKDHRNLNDLVESSGNVIFDAEDLVRGYRFDVFDENGAAGKRWYPLHERVTTHTIGTYGARRGDARARPRRGVPQEHLRLKRARGPPGAERRPVPARDGRVVGRLVARRPAARQADRGAREGEDGGESPLSRHDPGEDSCGRSCRW